MFADDSFASSPPPRSRLNDTARETLKHFRAGESVERIAGNRGLAASTIYGHLTTAIEAGEGVDLSQLVTAAEQEQIAAAFASAGIENLTAAHEWLKGKFDFGLLRLCRAAQPRPARM